MKKTNIEKRRAELAGKSQSELRTLARAELLGLGWLTPAQIKGSAPLAGGEKVTAARLRAALLDAYCVKHEGVKAESFTGVYTGKTEWSPSSSEAWAEAHELDAENRAGISAAHPEPEALPPLPPLPAPDAVPAAAVGAGADLATAITAAITAAGATGGATDEQLAELSDRLDTLAGQISAGDAAVRAELDTKLEPLKDLADAIAANPAAITGVSARRAAVLKSAVKGAGCPILAALTKAYGPAGSPMLGSFHRWILGAPACGKSHAVREFAKLNGYSKFVEHGCSPALEELAVVKGCAAPDGKGGFIVPDGKLTEAVRAAGSGETVLLFMDELARIHPIVQDWLLTFLQGVKTPTGREYHLTTSKADATGQQLEVITCKAENLHIVAAGNLERPIASAFWSRFIPVRIDFTEAHIEHVAASMLDAGGIAAHGNLPKAWAEVVADSREKTNEGSAMHTLSNRLFEDAVELAANNGLGVEAVAENLAETMRDVVGGFVAGLQGDHDKRMDAEVKKWANKLKAAAAKAKPATPATPPTVNAGE